MSNVVAKGTPGSDFVVYLDVDWQSQYVRNRQHFLIREIARQIEGRGQVLALERPVCLMTGPFRQRAKFVEWLSGRRGLRKEGNNLFLYTPFVWLHNVLATAVPGLTRANRQLLRWQVNRLLDRLAFRRRKLVAWVHHPYQLEDMGLVRERVLIYDCYDDYFSQALDYRLADLQRREAAILKRADLVFVASERLLRPMQDRAQHVHLVSNGVDVDFFSLATQPETKVPGEIAILPRPVIGFVGKLTPRLDFQLLFRLAALHPEWSMVFIGAEEDGRRSRSQPGYEDFRNAPNVYLLGPKSYETLPGYLKGYDVCLIPYVLDEFNLSSSPLKLYEYLASGKPVVSVDIPQVARLRPLVRIARNVAEFERAILASLAEGNDKFLERRLEMAREGAWGRRAKQVLALVKECT